MTSFYILGKKDVFFASMSGDVTFIRKVDLNDVILHINKVTSFFILKVREMTSF